jgi:lysophospholipase L1-like esterase
MEKLMSTPRSRTALPLKTLNVALLATLLSVQPLLAKPGANQKQWVGTWASSPLLDGRGKTADQLFSLGTQPGATLREVVHVSMGGETLRVRFSNLYGAAPLMIGAAEIAQTLKGAAIVSGSGKPLTFHGQPSTSIPPGALSVSDPVTFKLAPLSDVTVSFYLPSPSGPVTEHQLGNATSYHAAGNVVSSDVLDAPSTITSWEYLNGIDTLAAADAAAVITIGDSITDGAKSTIDTNQRWPDELARRLQADPKYRHLSVLNEGISGNKVLLDGAGPNVLARFDRDVLAQAGARYLLILEGINDIGRLHGTPDAGLTAADLISAYDQMIQRAHTHGIAVIGCTLTPYHGAGYYTEAGEAIRKAVNDWIRTSGAFDGIVDLEAAVRDPNHPDTFLPSVDPGDHLHPNDAGYKAMGDAIDLKLFTLKPKHP